ncbi:unnamed protein product [Amoebophrya sp. A25]|nr:unnamed protein product [Amoebophrya sp. A25]|eukprot:GSA25T00009810001.1
MMSSTTRVPAGVRKWRALEPLLQRIALPENWSIKGSCLFFRCPEEERGCQRIKNGTHLTSKTTEASRLSGASKVRQDLGHLQDFFRREDSTSPEPDEFELENVKQQHLEVLEEEVVESSMVLNRETRSISGRREENESSIYRSRRPSGNIQPIPWSNDDPHQSTRANLLHDHQKNPSMKKTRCRGPLRVAAFDFDQLLNYSRRDEALCEELFVQQGCYLDPAVSHTFRILSSHFGYKLVVFSNQNVLRKCSTLEQCQEAVGRCITRFRRFQNALKMSSQSYSVVSSSTTTSTGTTTLSATSTSSTCVRGSSSCSSFSSSGGLHTAILENTGNTSTSTRSISIAEDEGEASPRTASGEESLPVDLYLAVGRGDTQDWCRKPNPGMWHLFVDQESSTSDYHRAVIENEPAYNLQIDQASEDHDYESTTSTSSVLVHDGEPRPSSSSLTNSSSSISSTLSLSSQVEDVGPKDIELELEQQKTKGRPERMNLRIDYANSFFVGNSAGRHMDKTDFDRRFAENVGLRFYTEEFFPNFVKYMENAPAPTSSKSKCSQTTIE